MNLIITYLLIYIHTVLHRIENNDFLDSNDGEFAVTKAQDSSHLHSAMDTDAINPNNNNTANNLMVIILC